MVLLYYIVLGLHSVANYNDFLLNPDLFF